MEYSCLSPTQIELLKQNTIDLQGNINDRMVDYVREALIKLIAFGSPPATFLFHSNGGSIQAGLHIYDLIANYSGLSTGLVFGRADSMAALILQACQKRLSCEYGCLTIHNPLESLASWSMFFDPVENKRIKEVMKANREIFIKILLRRTGRNRQEIIEALDRGEKGEEMIAKKALEFGLVDEVIDYEKLMEKSPQPQGSEHEN